MRIAILGAGNVGSGLAAAAVGAGHEVIISATTAESAQRCATSAGATAADSNSEAVQGADFVLLAVPHSSVAEVARELTGHSDGKVIVDCTNPLNETLTDLTTSGESAGEVLQNELAEARVVKAFNTIFAARFTAPTEDGVPLDAFIAGDHEDAKSKVGELATSLGYRPIDVGGLRMARALEEMSLLNIKLNASNGWAWQTGWKLVGPTT